MLAWVNHRKQKFNYTKNKKIKNPVSPLMGPTKPIDVAHQAHPIVAAARQI